MREITVEHGDDEIVAQKQANGSLRCKYCSRVSRFDSIDTLRSHCSEQHGMSHHETRTCDHCGDSFRVGQWATTHYCSQACASKGSDNGMTETCQFCGRTLAAERHDAGYCTREQCMNLAAVASGVEVVDSD